MEAVLDAPLAELIAELDSKAEGPAPVSSQHGQPVRRRSHVRRPFRVPCTVRSPSNEVMGLTELPGHTRNLSPRGLSLLAQGAFSTGEVIEVQVTPTDGAAVHIVGVVRFCRYAGRGYCEVGMQILTARRESILFGTPGMPEDLLVQLLGETDTHLKPG